MWMDYVRSFPTLCSSLSLSCLTVLPQKNLPKVTAPGKLIYVDDGEWLQW